MRVSSKLFVLDPDDRLLLLDCTDPADPLTTWWELPGGGVEEGEDGVSAGVREVAEETGVLVPAGCVGPLQWTRVSSFTWRGSWHTALHEGRLAQLAEPPVVVPTQLTEAERGTVLGQRWWTRSELAAHPGAFFPTGLPALLDRLLAGEVVHEPDEVWTAVQHRPAARVLLLDPDGRVLLFRGGDPVAPERGTWWVTPGGGLEPGETRQQGAARELREETGLALDPDTLGEPVLHRTVEFSFAGARFAQDEEFFRARVGVFDVDTSGFSALEQRSVVEHRWWSVAELRATDEAVYPEGLADLLEQVG